ncbi:hypothetical protein RDABS01_004016, partial [Bienertia sinuspersici]
PSSFLNKLKLSLPEVIVQFYTLAGQPVTQRYINEHCCFIYINCHQGVGAKLIHAEAVELVIDDVLSPNTDNPDIVQSFFDVAAKDLINYDGHTKPLLSVQVTELGDGVIIGICIKHSIADGTSCLHFLNILFEIFMESSLIYKPVLMIKLPHVELDECIIQVHHTLLKTKANEEAAVKSSSIISSFQALSAFMWRCITRARSSCRNTNTTCGLVANLRPRLVPPLSQD